MQWVDFRSDIIFNGNSISFNEKHFVAKYLMRNSKIRDLNIFIKEIEDISACLSTDYRLKACGHDFIRLFYYAVKKRKGHKTGFHDEETFAGSLCACLEVVDIENEKLFKRVYDL